ncbi:K(+)-transporting ATPase subunit C [Nostoc sp. MG11]|uniref:K(+)-transporting ATPase subunit C n=1 Tax=Nostoc sp. MG11 TaxID=2721166 RepID=UPI001D0175FC|nr:K(+)-transporting ATPase subunit C [Nostoc sp. MG11]
MRILLPICNNAPALAQANVGLAMNSGTQAAKILDLDSDPTKLIDLVTNGSLLKNNTGQVVGSALIGQPFVSDRYFNSRPSTTSYSTANPKKDDAGVLQTGVSGASNLAPSNPALLERIKGKDNPDPSKRVEGDLNRLKTASVQPIADLVYTSGSSLDPHITPEAARVQVARVAKARGIELNQMKNLIVQNTDDRFLGIFGKPGVNVLQLNLALDRVGK